MPTDFSENAKHTENTMCCTAGHAVHGRRTFVDSDGFSNIPMFVEFVDRGELNLVDEY